MELADLFKPNDENDEVPPTPRQRDGWENDLGATVPPGPGLYEDYPTEVGKTFIGEVKSVVNTVRAIGSAISDPQGAAAGLWHAVTHPLETASAIRDVVVEKCESGSEGQGEVAGTVLQLFFGPKVVSEAVGEVKALVGLEVGGAAAGAADAGGLAGGAVESADAGAAASAASKLIGFSEAEGSMVQNGLKTLQQAGYDTSPLQEIIRADMPPGYRAMSLDGGAATGAEAL